MTGIPKQVTILLMGGLNFKKKIRIDKWILLDYILNQMIKFYESKINRWRPFVNCPFQTWLGFQEVRPCWLILKYL